MAGNLLDVIRAMRKLKYKVYQSSVKPYDLNIVGVRSAHPKVDKFSCSILVFWIGPKGTWQVVRYPATTLPGRYYLVDRLLNRKGCAILMPGQYVSSYAIGLHKGKSEALVQRKAVTVYRDGNRDSEFDYGYTEAGFFGMNIHGATNGVVPQVGKYSAGCQVIQSGQDYAQFRAICRLGSKHWGNSFTYTLIDENQIVWS